MSEFVETVIEFLRGHSRAYRQVFNRHSPAVQYVLADQAKFCHALDTIAKPGLSEFELGVREGRRQVWLRTNRALHLTPEEQFALIRQAKEIVK